VAHESRRRWPESQHEECPPHHLGNGGGFLKSGQYIDAGNVTNNLLFSTLITAATRDKNLPTPSFGMGTGSGMIAGMLA